MIWAQPHQIGEHVERNILGKVLLDEIHDAFLLPRGKPATWRGPCWRSPDLQETQQLDGQEATERLRIQASSGIGGTDLRHELADGFP